jgi:hypothetical protein
MRKLRVRRRALFLQGCTAYLYGAHTLFTGQREIERERERERGRERESKNMDKL